MSEIKAREILLKHLNKDNSKIMIKFNKQLVNHRAYLEAMEEYAELRIKQATEQQVPCSLENVSGTKFGKIITLAVNVSNPCTGCKYENDYSKCEACNYCRENLDYNKHYR